MLSFVKNPQLLRASEPHPPSLLPPPSPSSSDHFPLYDGYHTAYSAGYYDREHFGPSYADPMKTVDYRYREAHFYRRSSFALPDIFEEDEFDIEISSVLPTASGIGAPASTKSTSRRARLSRAVAAILGRWLSRRADPHGRMYDVPSERGSYRVYV
ncbi:hypothetical protein B0H21DRAFT_208894 [Amylocystis lapponica]|nr:hypothetical protein B0H21DRAFT_208894 [Amylocystis lapponica]